MEEGIVSVIFTFISVPVLSARQRRIQLERAVTMEKDIQSVLEMALEQGRDVLYEGKVANYSPELAKADSSNLGVCLMKKDGSIYKAGDYNIPFTMQSISKTFSLILALQTAGYDKVFSKIGMEPTGDRFDSILQLELKDWRPFNPMINAGAIVTATCGETDTLN